MSAGWQMTYRARYSNTKVKPVTKLLELLSPYWGWPDSAGVSWLAGWGLAVSRRFKTGLLVELSSPQSALESVMTRQHRLRRRAGELDAAWPQVANKVSSPRM